MTKSLKKNSFFNILYNAANVLFPLLTSMYVARVLLTDGIGRVAYAKNITSYFIIIATLGLPTYGVREIAKVSNDRTSTDKVFSELFSINALSTMISLILYLALILAVPRFHSEYLLFLCCGIQLVLNVFNIDWLYQGFEEYTYISIRSIAIKIFAFLCVIIIVKSKSDYIWYALISSLAVSANYIFNIIHARKYIKISFKNLNLRRHMKPLVILAASVFLSTAYSKTDITMLGIMSTESATGIYSNAHKIIDIVITLCASISAVFLPRLSYYYDTNNKNASVPMLWW